MSYNGTRVEEDWQDGTELTCLPPGVSDVEILRARWRNRGPRAHSSQYAHMWPYVITINALRDILPVLSYLMLQNNRSAQAMDVDVRNEA